MSNTININGQNINMEDLQAALEAQGLNIKELAKEASALKRGEVKTPENKATPTTTTYKLALVDYPDFCIERTTAKTRQLIVIMPSCQGYYVKSFKGGNEYIEELTSDLYSKMTAGMNVLEFPDGFWLNRAHPGKRFFDTLSKALRSETYLEMVKFHVAPKLEALNLDGYHTVESNECVSAYKNQPILYREFFNTNKAKRVLMDSPNFIKCIVNDFGLNNTRDFLKELELSLVEVGTSYSARFGAGYRSDKIYPNVEMKYEAFRDYVLYQSVFMGYGKSINTFFDEWRDSIRMQQDVYHKIKEKYHDNLPLWHHQLAYKSICMKEEIDAEKMQKMVEFASLYQGVCDKYVFVAPTCKQDFLDEAQMQQNCLASYVNKFIDGNCIIMFMRLKDTPTQSLVTIEICKDDEGNYTVLNQKYQARNRACTQEQSNAIDKWLKRTINRINKKKKDGEIEVDEELTKILKYIKEA
jgi:hypothetical protein